MTRKSKSLHYVSPKNKSFASDTTYLHFLIYARAICAINNDIATMLCVIVCITHHAQKFPREADEANLINQTRILPNQLIYCCQFFSLINEFITISRNRCKRKYKQAIFSTWQLMVLLQILLQYPSIVSFHF